MFMDLYKIPSEQVADFPGGHRFSWIAFDPEEASQRVLFDSHPPKGPHIHVDGDQDGEPFQWVSVDAAKALFLERIQQHFGEFAEELKL